MKAYLSIICDFAFAVPRWGTKKIPIVMEVRKNEKETHSFGANASLNSANNLRFIPSNSISR